MAATIKKDSYRYRRVKSKGGVIRGAGGCGPVDRDYVLLDDADSMW